ncbi:hypothetical protein SAY86_002094 [Trapa natans]|uniref:PTC1-like winged helix-turn-helix domain-containing protein n=1 Tax=Trapa natans TaxID=22666 RepID=A0AAN7R254_TRANT|nr:hypothetical protein SAY86_002094 [Trapa natans]
MREKGAVFGNLISRPKLRVAGHKHIGDTGLLDHLLKQIDGKVAPGGTERFRRWFNPNGIMEYWLESVELDEVRREAGIQDPYWLPSLCREPSSSSDIKLVKEDIFNMKRELAELVSKKKEQDEANSVERVLKELTTSQAKTDQRIIEISTSLQGMQECCVWKLKICLLFYRTYVDPVVNPNPVKWEEWLESTNLEEGMQGNDITTMLVKTDPINTEWNGDPYSSLPTRWKAIEETDAGDAAFANELAMLKEEVATVKRYSALNACKKYDSVPDWNIDASVNVSRQLDFKNTSALLPEMYKQMSEWRTNVEQQMKEVLNAVRSMQQGANQFTAIWPSS